MKAYQYQILRYQHDIVTGEFVNVGIVLYQPESHFLKSLMLHKFGRISEFFQKINGYYLINTLKSIAQQVSHIEAQFTEIFAHQYLKTNLGTITKQILPQDDSALYFSEVETGIDISPETALSDLFERIVNKYQDQPTQYRTDEVVWRDIYKDYFEKNKLTQKLTQHIVKTNTDEFEFDMAWKNGTWHIYEPISLNLQDSNTIKDKVYKWNGRLNELNSANEELVIHFLTEMPESTQLQKFIEEKLVKELFNNLKIELVKPQEAEKFARKVRQEIEEHLVG